MPSITSANAIFMLGVTNLYDTPQQMQGFDVDEAFDAEAVSVAETKIGVDGILSAGFIFETVKMSIALQADSVSLTFMEGWYTAERSIRDKYSAFGVIRHPALGRSYTLNNGYLKNYSPLAGAKKVLAVRKFMIEWETIIGTPL